ncbi:5'-3'-deoxyribonucleotidase [Candidatus Woesearchaeota archaeon]|nr:5'-3'-deoxyribonucleotidase [Candidatus Woesearchaeota archaeon]
MIILVDMDDVLADFEGEFFNRWRAQYPDKPYVALEDRTIFNIENQYPEDLRELVKSIYNAPGFCKSLKPIDGSLESVLEMQNEGHEVYICTAPLTVYENCVLEKYQWAEQHLGLEWVKKIILTRDKTLVRGDFLIDDKPEVTGAAQPVWEHILFNKAYNKNVTGKRRLATLKDWKTILTKP